MSGFGNNPFFNTVLSLTAIKTWLQAQALTFTNSLTITKTAQTGTAETAILKVNVSDDANGRFEISNGVATDGLFAPLVHLRGPAGTGVAGYIYGQAVGGSDSGTSPILLFDGRVNVSAAATRPPFAWATGGTRLGTWWPSGLMIGSGTSTAAAAKLEVQSSNESQIAFGNNADRAFLTGHNNVGAILHYGSRFDGTNYIARQTGASMVQVLSAGIRFYINGSGLTIGNTFTPTAVAYMDATGLGVGGVPACKHDVVGTIRATSAGAPATGSGVLVDFGAAAANTGRIWAYNHGTPGYLAMQYDGSSHTFKVSGTSVLALNSATAVFVTAPKLPNYTTGTRPSASTLGAGAAIYDTTISKPIFSNGTSWLDAAGAAA